MSDKTYSELSRIELFEDRLDYLLLTGRVGEETFGFDRWINQEFYRSTEWHNVREFVIVRDNGCDLGVPGYEIFEGPLVHHMNPMTAEDIAHGADWIIDPEFLITTTQKTHNEIHYGFKVRRPAPVIQRSPGDTTLW